MKLLYILFITFASSLANTPQLPTFFEELYNRNKGKIDSVFYNTFSKGMKKVRGSVNDKNNQDIITRIIFYHFLFTSNDASDCSKGGVLEIPYFWHWISPNPRHKLVYLPLSQSLADTKPPKGFEKYKSYADVDRTPYLYFSNLVSDSALFYHPECGRFYTFGWCSEREMAFSNLMTHLGYTIKIKQKGIHVWSEALVEIESSQGPKKIILEIDNTFHRLHFRNCTTTPSKWKRDFGNGQQVEWYNKKALSQKELQMVRNLRVTQSAKKRITTMVSEWLRR